MLGDGFHDVPPGKVAAVVTHLEMHAPAAVRPVPLPDELTFARVQDPDVDWYRDLYQRVGGNWLWFSRLNMSSSALAAILGDKDVEVYALSRDGRAEGLMELDFRGGGACELAFFGLTQALIGSGSGRYLMNEAITRAWARPIPYFFVHTCTLDSAGALDFYRRSGFVPVRQQIEVADDPRLGGALPKQAAPQIPMFEG